MLRNEQIKLGLATIHKALTQHQVEPIVIYRQKLDFKRYSKPIPGERVQMDICKIAPNLYQYTAIDDCTRYRVLDSIASTAVNTVSVIKSVIDAIQNKI